MATPIRRSAASIVWSDPAGNACTLTPMSGGKGLLEIELSEDVVVICVSGK